MAGAETMTRLTMALILMLLAPMRAETPPARVWTFLSAQDNAVAELVVNNEGTAVGATPDGYAQIRVQVQDEVPNCQRPPCSSNVNARLRVMSQQFNHNAGCVGTQCPDMTELYSDGALRLTAAGGRTVDLVTGNKTRIAVTGDGILKLPVLGPSVPPGQWYAICVDQYGSVMMKPRCE